MAVDVAAEGGTVMIPHSELREGWYIARAVTGKLGEERGLWSFVWVGGQQPFLQVWPAIEGVEKGGWRRAKFDYVDYPDHDWEFLQRIDIPQEGE